MGILQPVTEDDDNKGVQRKKHSAPLPKYLYSLDALRGCAALAVVFVHWGHFFYEGAHPAAAFNITKLPFYFLFEPFYIGGGRAVDLFFCLSGFIFFWLYRSKISARQTGAWSFFILRFSRLYPLHFLTLIAVVIGQLLMRLRYHTFFVYEHNDLFHFALQIVFASNWGFREQQVYTFNGPIWSVSVEVLCYTIFFVVAFIRIDRKWLLVALICCGFLLQMVGFSDVGRGIFSFFVGGTVFLIFKRIVFLGNPRTLVWSCLGLTLTLWVIIPLNAYHGLMYNFYRAHFWPNNIGTHGKDIVGAAILTASQLLFEIILFPATIISIALLEIYSGGLARRLNILGHISYSSYLLHFPLQLFFFIIISYLGISRDFFYSSLSMVLFFFFLIPLSIVSYHYYELPCQSWIRNLALRRSLSDVCA